MSGEIKEINNEILRITQSVVVHTPKYSKFGGYDGENDIYTMDIAKHLYEQSYRKQSEGEWLPSPDGIQPIRCSKCNMTAPFVAVENEFGDFEICRYPSKYCHECGAKMKGGAE